MGYKRRNEILKRAKKPKHLPAQDIHKAISAAHKRIVGDLSTYFFTKKRKPQPTTPPIENENNTASTTDNK